MGASTEQELRDFLGGLEGVSSVRVTLLLATARRTVLRDGIAEDDESFGDLHRVYTAHLLDTGGAIGGAVASKSIGDVSTSFARNQAEESTSWIGLYRQLRTQITGLDGRIA